MSCMWFVHFWGFFKNVWLDKSSAPCVVWMFVWPYSNVFLPRSGWRLVPVERIPQSTGSTHTRTFCRDDTIFFSLVFLLCHPLQLMNLRFSAPLGFGLCLLAAPPLHPPGLIDWKRSCGTGWGWPQLNLQAQGLQAWLSAWSSDGLHGSSAADTPWWGRCPSNAPGRQQWPELESREGWEEKRRR